MALAFVQAVTSTTEPDSTHNNGTITSVGNGNIIVGAMIWNSGSEPTGLNITSGTDTSGDTVTLRGTVAQSGVATGYYVRCFTVVNASNTANHTISILRSNSLGITSTILHLLEYSGQHATPFDTSVTAVGTTTLATLNFTTANANEMLVAFAAQDSTPTVTGTTSIRSSSTQGWYERGIDNPVTSSGSNSIAFTNTPNSFWAMSGVAIIPAGGAAATWGRLLGNETNRLVRMVG